MKGLILVFVVLMVVSVDVQAAVNQCLIDCQTKQTTCMFNAAVCTNPDSCNTNCVVPFGSCMNGCRRKREFLSKFFRDFDEEE